MTRVKACAPCGSCTPLSREYQVLPLLDDDTTLTKHVHERRLKQGLLDGLSVHLLPPDSALSLLGRGHSIGNYLGATAQLVESDGYGPLLAWTLVMGGCDLLRITNSEHFFSWSSSFFHHQVLFWPFRDSSIRSRRPWYGFDAAFV
jgi:hypothetical protein